VIWDGGRAVRFVDKRGEVSVFSLAEAVGRREVVERLKVVAKELGEWADVVVAGKKVRKA